MESWGSQRYFSHLPNLLQCSENVSRKEYIYDNNFPVLPSSQYKGTVIVQLPVNIPASVNTAKWIAVNYVGISHLRRNSDSKFTSVALLENLLNWRSISQLSSLLHLPYPLPKWWSEFPFNNQWEFPLVFLPPLRYHPHHQSNFKPMAQQSLRTTRTSFMPDQYFPVSNLQIPGPYPAPMPPPEVITSCTYIYVEGTTSSPSLSPTHVINSSTRF